MTEKPLPGVPQYDPNSIFGFPQSKPGDMRAPWLAQPKPEANDLPTPATGPEKPVVPE